MSAVNGVGTIPTFTFNHDSDAEKAFYDFFNAIFNGNAAAYTNEQIIGMFESFEIYYKNKNGQIPQKLLDIMNANGINLEAIGETYSLPDASNQ